MGDCHVRGRAEKRPFCGSKNIHFICFRVFIRRMFHQKRKILFFCCDNLMFAFDFGVRHGMLLLKKHGWFGSFDWEGVGLGSLGAPIIRSKRSEDVPWWSPPIDVVDESSVSLSEPFLKKESSGGGAVEREESLSEEEKSLMRSSIESLMLTLQHFSPVTPENLQNVFQRLECLLPHPLFRQHSFSGPPSKISST